MAKVKQQIRITALAWAAAKNQDIFHYSLRMLICEYFIPCQLQTRRRFSAIQAHVGKLQLEYLNHYFNFLSGIFAVKQPLRQARKRARYTPATALFF